MATYGSLQTALATDLHRSDNAFTSRAQEAIVNAIRHYRAERFTWNTKRVTDTLVTDTEYHSLSADWVEIDIVTLVDGQNRYPLIERPPEELNEKQWDSSYTGMPVWYAMSGAREMRLYPPTDQTYSLEMVYLYDLPEITLSASSAATNAWLDEGYELVKLHAMVELAVEYLHGEEMAAAAARWKQMEIDVLNQLRRRSNRARSSGHITPSL